MKKIRIITAIALLASMVACNPIEDKSLRDDYITNAGTPVTSEELTSYLHVDQPYPNTETAVEGDQIVSLKNDRPEIGGVWHVVTSMGETILKSDSCTYTYESNGEFEVYYVALSAGKIVESAHFPITVTNVFDPWAGYLTGAKDLGLERGLMGLCLQHGSAWWLEVCFRRLYSRVQLLLVGQCQDERCVRR